jgi:HIV Tat-specific factor 1
VQENAKKQKKEQPKERVNTAVYVESLPRDATEEELFECFSRYGVIAESIDDNKPRIKMYYNENGEFNGDALIGIFCHGPSSSIPNAHPAHSLLPTRVCQSRC